MPIRDETRGLLERLQAGERAVVDALLERLFPAVKNAVRVAVGATFRRRPDFDDLVQAAMLKLITTLPNFEYRGERKFASWLSGLVESTLRDAGRFDRRACRDVRRTVSIESSAAQRLEIPYCGPTPSGRLRESEFIERLAVAMETLTPEARRVCADVWLLGLTVAEVAERDGKKRDAVRMQVDRARARVARMLEQNEEDERSGRQDEAT